MSGTVHLKSGRGGGWTVRDLLCVKYYGPFNSCVFFPDPPLFIVRKIMAPTAHFPDNLEENVHVKMVLIVEKARFAMAIGLSILHSSVLKMRQKFAKFASDIFNCISCHVRLPMQKRLSRDFDIHLFHFKLFISSSNLNKYM